MTLMQSLEIRDYGPGEVCVAEGAQGAEVYIIIATEESVSEAELEIIKATKSNTEIFLTRLNRGKYFGEREAFMWKRFGVARGATVRVPKDSPCK
jgi:CRP-like cAMP-binding protein